MFRSLEDVMDVAVHATDGEIGKVRNFLLDDQSWRIRYLVVAVGSWFSRRDAIIAVGGAAVEPGTICWASARREARRAAVR